MQPERRQSTSPGASSVTVFRFRKRSVTLLAFVQVVAACATGRPEVPAPTAVLSSAAGCDIATATPWMRKWLTAWEVTSRDLLRVPPVQAPDFLFFDARCVYTTIDAKPAANPGTAPSLFGIPLFWRAFPHHDTLTFPGWRPQPVGITTFADVDKRTGRPFFVMAAPSYWTAKGMGSVDFIPVFLHEFTHTRQIKAVARILGPIDSAWKLQPGLDDDVVQTHFKSDSTYVAAYVAERDLLYRAAAADSVGEVRALASQALAMMRARHARWFVGERAVFSVLDDIFLSMEGAAQWAAYAWLAHPSGGALTRPAAVARMSGRHSSWSQDEGLAVFLVVDRLMPDWPSLVFNEPSIGGITLLERAINR